MSIILTVGATVLALSDDLYWADENDWHPVRQAAEYSLTGALVLDAGTMLAGRPITLRPPDSRAAWMPRSTIDQLRAWAAIAGQQMTLTLRGAAHTVVWRHQDPPALSAEPVLHYSDVAGADPYTAVLKFTKV